MDRNIAKLFPTCHNKKQEKSLISHLILMIAITEFIIRNVLFSLSFYSLSIVKRILEKSIYFLYNSDYTFNPLNLMISNAVKIS